MCEVCLRTPCDSRCPNAPDPPAVFICSNCGRDIRDGDPYWDILGEQFCEKCIKSFEHTAEAEVDYEID